MLDKRIIALRRIISVVERIRELKIYGRGYEGVAFVDEEDYQRFRLWEYSWNRKINHRTTYVRTNKNGKSILLHRLILGLLGSPQTVIVDHIDHNGFNNLRSNLRITDNLGNHRNRIKGISPKYTSFFKGVSKRPVESKRPWRVWITPQGKRKWLGNFSTEKEAAQAYNKAAMELFGTMAYLNELSDRAQKEPLSRLNLCVNGPD